MSLLVRYNGQHHLACIDDGMINQKTEVIIFSGKRAISSHQMHRVLEWYGMTLIIVHHKG